MNLSLSYSTDFFMKGDNIELAAQLAMLDSKMLDVCHTDDYVNDLRLKLGYMPLVKLDSMQEPDKTIFMERAKRCVQNIHCIAITEWTHRIHASAAYSTVIIHASK